MNISSVCFFLCTLGQWNSICQHKYIIFAIADNFMPFQRTENFSETTSNDNPWTVLQNLIFHENRSQLKVIYSPKTSSSLSRTYDTVHLRTNWTKKNALHFENRNNFIVFLLEEFFFFLFNTQRITFVLGQYKHFKLKWTKMVCVCFNQCWKHHDDFIKVKISKITKIVINVVWML